MKFRKVVSLDIETTGFNLLKDCIIEIGAVKYCPSTKKKTYFETLVHPCKPVPAHIAELTGIDTRTIAKGPTLTPKDAARAFFDFIGEDWGKTLYVGHGIDTFDLPRFNLFLLANAIPRIKETQTWDTLKKFRAYNKKMSMRGRNKGQKSDLAAAIKYYRIKRQGAAHRALSDSKATLDVFLKLCGEKRKLFYAGKQGTTNKHLLFQGKRHENGGL